MDATCLQPHSWTSPCSALPLSPRPNPALTDGPWHKLPLPHDPELWEAELRGSTLGQILPQGREFKSQAPKARGLCPWEQSTHCNQPGSIVPETQVNNLPLAPAGHGPWTRCLASATESLMSYSKGQCKAEMKNLWRDQCKRLCSLLHSASTQQTAAAIVGLRCPTRPWLVDSALPSTHTQQPVWPWS
jgi:hypothetical protein